MINGGVLGDIIMGGLFCVVWMLMFEVDVMIVMFGGNDFLCGFDFVVSKVNIVGIVEIVKV